MEDKSQQVVEPTVGRDPMASTSIRSAIRLRCSCIAEKNPDSAVQVAGGGMSSGWGLAPVDLAAQLGALVTPPPLPLDDVVGTETDAGHVAGVVEQGTVEEDDVACVPAKSNVITAALTGPCRSPPATTVSINILDSVIGPPSPMGDA